jgi:hypothetical protein
MKPPIRFAFIAVFGAALSFIAPRVALAQNTDEAHARCAQGGGPAFFSGAGEPNVGGIGSADHGGNHAFTVSSEDPESGASGGDGGSGGGSSSDGGSGGGSLSAFAHAAANSENAAGAGGEGASGGLGGSSAGGGAGGCGPDTAPHRLPATGSSIDHVGFMGTGFVLLGGLLVAATQLWPRRRAIALALNDFAARLD